jgi:putative DNA primase/helicase
VSRSPTAPRRSKAAIESAAERPKCLPVNPDGILAELKARQQWVAWRSERRHGRWTKVPIDPHNGKRASATDPTTWATFDEALVHHRTHGLDGVGYVFIADDPYTGTDLDDALDPETGTVAEWATPILDELNSYTELSPSGTGIKCIIRAKKNGTRCKKVYQGNKVEMYDRARFFALTGQMLAGMPAEIADRQEQLDRLYTRVFEWHSDKKRTKQDGRPTGKSASAASSNSHSATLSDEDILKIANRAANGDKFRRLWAGDTSGHDDDDSRADCALCTMIAFYTRDKQQIDRLFRQSALMRNKWDERRGQTTYGQLTIDAALEYQQDHYEPRQVMGTLRFSTNGQHTAEDGPHLTDRGNAIRLVQQHGGNLRHCHPWAKWLVWDERRWRIDDTAATTRRAKETIVGLFRWAKQTVERISKHLEDTAHENEA